MYSRVRVVFVCESCVLRHNSLHSAVTNFTNSLRLFNSFEQKGKQDLSRSCLEKEPQSDGWNGFILGKEEGDSKATKVEGNSSGPEQRESSDWFIKSLWTQTIDGLRKTIQILKLSFIVQLATAAIKHTLTFCKQKLKNLAQNSLQL